MDKHTGAEGEFTRGDGCGRCCSGLEGYFLHPLGGGKGVAWGENSRLRQDSCLNPVQWEKCLEEGWKHWGEKPGWEASSVDPDVESIPVV